MKTHPLIFSAPMMRALLEGRKTMTRRLLKPQPIWREAAEGLPGGWEWAPYRGKNDRHPLFGAHVTPEAAPTDVDLRALITINGLLPYAPGDLIWVKETTWINGGYVATDSPNIANEGKCSSRFMTRLASRLTLRITDVRVQKVGEISWEDALAEGCEKVWRSGFNQREGYGRGDMWSYTPVAWFEKLWNSLYGPDAWDRNDWVVALTFDVLHANVDDVLREAA